MKDGFDAPDVVGMVCGIALIVAVTGIASCNSGHIAEAKEQRELAIKAGVGAWHIDPVTGATDFRYGVQKLEPKP